MVNLPLTTLEDLRNSGFGRPFPRHGLQLLFWFANSCVLQLNNFVDIMKVAYYEVGNLNKESHPGSSNLPSYVRENYDFKYCHGNDNMDRIIISYQVTTRVIKKVYITEHGGVVFGRFSPDRTHEISPELIQALQSPYLDRTTFLTLMGYHQTANQQHHSNVIFTNQPNQETMISVQRS
ncbi:hypothetical protein LDENG_00135320 [Lucifuga dentata]|nr:hypothetical protein LDENG_00135320 [Lucifuga dentata]